MNLFIDCKTTNNNKKSDLVSMAVVSENDSFFYAEFTDFDTREVTYSVKESLFPTLECACMDEMRNRMNAAKYRNNLGVGVDYENWLGSHYDSKNPNSMRGSYTDSATKQYKKQLNVGNSGNEKMDLMTGSINNKGVYFMPDGTITRDYSKFSNAHTQPMRNKTFYGDKEVGVVQFLNWLMFQKEDASVDNFYLWFNDMNHCSHFHDFVSNGDVNNLNYELVGLQREGYSINTLMKAKKYKPNTLVEELATKNHSNFESFCETSVSPQIRNKKAFSKGNPLYEALMAKSAYSNMYKLDI